MTKQTLRKKLIKKFEIILEEHAVDNEVAGVLADAALEEIREKPAFDKKQADPAWEILFGNRDQADVDEEKVRQAALEEFERALKLPPLNWYPNRKAEEAFMTVLRNLVVEVYKKDRTAFTRYETWRQDPYARGAVSNATIKSYPEKFVFSWSDFERATGSSKPKNNSQVEVDDNGTTFTY